MVGISVIVLLSSVAWACAGARTWSHPTWTPECRDKLADRAFMAWSLQHGLLEDTMHAKPQTAGGKLAAPTSPCKSLFKVPLVQSPLRSPLPRAPAATVDQVDRPNPPVKERLLGRLAKAKAWVIPGLEYLTPIAGMSGAGLEALAPIAGMSALAATPEELQAAISIAGLTPPETPRQKAETRSVNDDVDAAEASAKEGSRYFGQDSLPLPGVLPEMITPNEAASVNIAGLTPRKEEDESRIFPFDPQHLGDHPGDEEANTQEKWQERENQEQEGEGATDHSAKTHPDRAHLIDSEIDKSIKSSFKFDSFNFDDSRISANARKAWEYSHGLSARKAPLV